MVPADPVFRHTQQLLHPMFPPEIPITVTIPQVNTSDFRTGLLAYSWRQDLLAGPVVPLFSLTPRNQNVTIL
jgi:hypothetical protein